VRRRVTRFALIARGSSVGIASDHLDARSPLPQPYNIANFKTKNS